MASATLQKRTSDGLVAAARRKVSERTFQKDITLPAVSRPSTLLKKVGSRYRMQKKRKEMQQNKAGTEIP